MAAAQVPPLPTLEIGKDLELAERRQAINSALGTTAAEGEMPSPAALELGEQYASGKISLDQFGDAVRALYGV
jgi:hypothetical protein